MVKNFSGVDTFYDRKISKSFEFSVLLLFITVLFFIYYTIFRCIIL